MRQEVTSTNATPKLPENGSQFKWLCIVLGGLLLIAWFVLGIYLHVQVAQSRAKVEQARIEAARRQEFQRRGVRYKQQLNEFNRGTRSRNVFEGR